MWQLQTTISKLETKLDGDGALTPDELRKFLAHVPVATLRVALYDWHTGQLWDRDVTENREMLSDTWWDGCPAMKKQPKKACVDELVTIYIDEEDPERGFGDWSSHWLTDKSGKL